MAATLPSPLKLDAIQQTPELSFPNFDLQLKLRWTYFLGPTSS
jgi:hypothetical protein